MSEINKITTSESSEDQMLDQLRIRALEEFEAAPVVAGHDRVPKEMRTRNSKVIVRGLIVLMAILVLVEGIIIFRVQSTPVPANLDTNVPVTVRQAPEPEFFDAPPVEGQVPIEVTDNPVEFSAPLPDELESDIASGEVAPLPDEFPPPDFSEDVAESDS